MMKVKMTARMELELLENEGGGCGQPAQTLKHCY